ncbi:MAG: cupin domain-containing protein [Acidobacteria bacterium]|nr:cupin domain-containing protein [Acidobacteriota bacterium]
MSPSPRPTFDKPTHIPYEAATRHVWGDDVAGKVMDWIYVSSGKIHQLLFSMPSGGRFRHSDQHRTIFAADELYYVISGTFVMSNPETGEVHRVNAGEAAFFRRDTWHHGFNYGTEPLRVLEFFAPPPSQGTSSAYAKTKPNLAECRYTQDQWIENWPMARADAERNFRFKMVRDSDLLWRMEGSDNGGRQMVGILVSTDQLTVGKLYLLPGRETEIEVHGGDESLYLLEGNLGVCVESPDSSPWFELKPGDGFFLPQGTRHQYRNISDRPAVVLFGVAPNYLPR